MLERIRGGNTHNFSEINFGAVRLPLKFVKRTNRSLVLR